VNETVIASIATHAHRLAGRPAVWSDRPSRLFTWDELARRVRLLALGLAGDGLDAGSRVVLDLPDGVDLRVADLAAQAAGAITVLTDAAATGTAREVGAVLTISDGDTLADLAARGAGVDAARPDAYEELVADVAVTDPATLCRVDGGWLAFTHEQLWWAARSLALALGLGPDDRIVSTLSVHRPAGRVASHVLGLCSGAATGLPPTGPPGPDGPAAAVAVTAPTVVVTDDTGLAALDRAVTRATASAGPGRERLAGSTVGVLHRAGTRRVRAVTGLAECRAVVVVDPWARVPVIERLRAAGVEVLRALAAPYAGGVLTLEQPDAAPAGTAPAGTAGRPLPGVVLGIADDGDVVARSAAFGHRWSLDGGAVPLTGPDGWVATGSQGAIGPDDVLRLRGEEQ
jgi:hypothetical protein